MAVARLYSLLPLRSCTTRLFATSVASEASQGVTTIVEMENNFGSVGEGEVKHTSFPLHKIKVVLLENIHPKAVDHFKKAGFTVETHKKALSGQDLIEVAGNCHILGIRSKTNLTADFFESIGWHKRRLWAVGCFCIGTNQVDLTAASAKGVPVFNAPFSNTRSVAEKTLAEIISLTRRLFERSSQMHSGIWTKSADKSHEVRGKVLGIVGYGRIGSQLSILAELLGMEVIFYDPVKKLPLGNARQVPTLDVLLRTADIVSLHVPSTLETHNLISKDNIEMMKPGSHLVNNARGNVVDLDALADAIKGGHIAGAAIDVFPEEPASNNEPFLNCPLQGLPNVILTPHIGGSTIEAQENIADEVASKLTRLMNHGSTTTATNLPELELPDLASSKHRILMLLRNEPTALQSLRQTLTAQLPVDSIKRLMVSTHSDYAYASIDVSPNVSEPLQREINGLSDTIWVRSIF